MNGMRAAGTLTGGVSVGGLAPLCGPANRSASEPPNDESDADMGVGGESPVVDGELDAEPPLQLPGRRTLMGGR